MKRNSYDHDKYMKDKMLSYVDTKASSESTFTNAMKVYRLFAYVAGAVCTAAYVISQMF